MIFKTNNDEEGSTFGQTADIPVGFHGSKSVRGTVTGARSSNVALTNLLIALELKGILIDSSTT